MLNEYEDLFRRDPRLITQLKPSQHFAQNVVNTLRWRNTGGGVDQIKNSNLISMTFFTRSIANKFLVENNPERRVAFLSPQSAPATSHIYKETGDRPSYGVPECVSGGVGLVFDIVRRIGRQVPRFRGINYIASPSGGWLMLCVAHENKMFITLSLSLSISISV